MFQEQRGSFPVLSNGSHHIQFAHNNLGYGDTIRVYPRKSSADICIALDNADADIYIQHIPNHLDVFLEPLCKIQCQPRNHL